MKLRLIALGLLAAGSLAVAAPAAPIAHGASIAQSPVAASQCRHHAYSRAHCTIVPSHGYFYVTTPGVAAVFRGIGSPATAGTEIETVQVQNPCYSTRAGSFQLTAYGPMPPLTLISPGTLYQYNSGTGTCTRISQILGSGTYEVVYPGGTPPAAKSHTRHSGHSKKKKPGKKTKH